MKSIFQLICLLLVANCAMACSNTENDVPLGPIGETPAEEDLNATYIYLWPEGNMPTITSYTVNNGNYQDDPDFRPNMVWYPVPDGVEVKGAVMVCPGGAFMFRSGNEGAPVAERLAELGWQSFVVNYRVRPYTMEEGSLDLARAIRYVRSHAADYGINPDRIASVGFSAGGILCGDEALHFDGQVNGTALDDSYVPDALDDVSADVCAIGMIYSFYGRLSVSNNRPACREYSPDILYLRYGRSFLPPVHRQC